MLKRRRQEHYSRLSWFQRFSGPEDRGAPLESEIDEALATAGLLKKAGMSRPRDTPLYEYESVSSLMRSRLKKLTLSPPVPLWKLSPEGDSVLQERQARRSAARALHDDLANRLAQWLARSGRLVLLNRAFVLQTSRPLLDALPDLPQPDERFIQRQNRPACYVVRPDVISIEPTPARHLQEPWIIEVKTRRTDFDQEMLRPEKRACYAMLAERVFYGCPRGLIAPNEIPDGFGLITESPTCEIEIPVEAIRRTIRHYAHLKRFSVPNGADAQPRRSPTPQSDA
jgi:hypothetical protein